MKQPSPRILPRGRIAAWSKEQLEKLTTPDLRALLDNAERLHEGEIATLCSEILDSRPHGHAPSRRRRAPGTPRGLVSRNKAFQMHGVQLRSRIWSCGGVRADGGVLLALSAEQVSDAPDGKRCLLWSPNVADSRPWSDSRGGQERLEHCRLALERGDAQALLLYGKGTEAVDAATVLKLSVEKRDDEYWATWVPEKRATVRVVE